MRYFKAFLSVFLLVLALFVGYILWSKSVFTSQPVQSNQGTDKDVSNFTYLLSKNNSIKGKVIPASSVTNGVRPTCEGEYYLDTGSETLWLAPKDSSKEERVASYTPYVGATVEVNGIVYKNGNTCDDAGDRYCECYDSILVNDIKRID
jgi:hypothetical protein